MTVEEMLEEMEHAIGLTDGWGSQALAAAKAIGIPLETLAALRDGSWQAVPVQPTDGMLDELDVFAADVLVDGRPSADEVEAVWAAMLAAAPAKPGDGA